MAKKIRSITVELYDDGTIKTKNNEECEQLLRESDSDIEEDIYICPECGRKSSLLQWNKATERAFILDEDDTITYLDNEDFNEKGKNMNHTSGDCIYVCPKCRNEVAGRDIRKDIDAYKGER